MIYNDLQDVLTAYDAGTLHSQEGARFIEAALVKARDSLGDALLSGPAGEAYPDTPALMKDVRAALPPAGKAVGSINVPWRRIFAGLIQTLADIYAGREQGSDAVKGVSPPAVEKPADPVAPPK